MYWKESLKQQALALKQLMESTNIDESVNSFISLSRKVQGFHFFSGIGKNMFVAARVAATYESLGIRSIYVDPVNSLHGSMGIFSQADLLIAISKSGETQELIGFLLALKKQGFGNIVGVTADRESTLSKLSVLTLYIPIIQEGDHLGLAPIASTMLFSALLDSIAVQMSSEKGYSREDFVRNHPGGNLGKTVL